MLSVIFKKRIVQAFTMVTTFLSLATLSGTLVIALQLISVTYKLYIAMSLGVFAILCYITLEVLLKKGIL